MSSKTVALGIVIGASLGRGYFSVFDSAKKRAEQLGQAFAETNKKLSAAREVEQYRQQLIKLQAEHKKTGQGEKDIQKVSKALEKAEAIAQKYGVSLGDIAKQQRQLASESAKLGRTIQYRQKADDAKQSLSENKGRLLGVVGTVKALWEPVMAWFAEKFAWIGQSISWVKEVFNQSATASMRPVGATQKSPFGTTASAASPLPSQVVTPKSGNTVTHHHTTTINVQQKPGENNQDLAKRVAQEIKRQDSSDKRRALHD